MDEEYARERFSGKTKDQAKELIKEDFLSSSEDLAWMNPEMFSFYIDSVIELADEGLHRFCDESCEVLEFIISMLELRFILHAGEKNEPLESINKLLAKCKIFCESIIQSSDFHKKCKHEQRLIASPLKRIKIMEAQYAALGNC